MVSKLLSLILASVAFMTGPSVPNSPARTVQTALPAHRMNEVVPGYVLVKTRPSVAASLSKQYLAGRQPTAPPFRNVPFPITYTSRVFNTGWTMWKIPTAVNPNDAAATLARDSRVLYAQPVHRVYPLLPPPNDLDWNVLEDDTSFYLNLGDTEPPHFKRLWHLDDIGAFDAWSLYPNTWYTSATKPANAPLIAIVDTGCDMNHPDFINAGGSSTDAAFGGQLVKSLSKQFELGDIKIGGSTEDLNGHGTHVSGLAVAAGNNGGFSGHGVIGSGYNSRAMILRVFDDQGVGQDSDAAAAIFYAADQGADIINISLGTTSYSQLFQDAVTYAWQKGSLVVCAGNESGSGGGPLGPIYPAQCSGALAVTANGRDGFPANDPTYGYAGTGDYLDISAPGGWLEANIDYYIIQFVFSTAMRTPGTLSENPNLVPPYTLDYSYLLGTSMATPIVSGAAGLYYGYKGLHQQDGWVNDRAFRALETSASDVMGISMGAWGTDQGYGVLNAYALLNDLNSRAATVGAAKGIVYYGATPIANVAVKAKKVSGGLTFTTTTRADGTYRFGALSPGIYNVWAAPFGSLKTKQAVIKAGNDQNGLDFWCGGYTGDETAPVVPKFDVLSTGSSSITVRHWGYDTETGLDSIVFRIGLTPGASDVMGDTTIVPDGNTVTLNGITWQGNRFYYLQGVYTNGNGQSTTVTKSFVVGAPVPVSVVASPNPVTGGLRSLVTVKLSSPAPAGGVQVNLRYSSPIVTGPASVLVAEGATDARFYAKTAKVRRDTTCIIEAKSGLVATTTSLLIKMTTVNYAVLKSVSVSPTSIVGGGQVTVTVQLEQPAPGGLLTVVSLVSDNSHLNLPTSVLVPTGQTQASVQATTTAVATTQIATIKASYRGVDKTTPLTITP